MKCQRCDAEVEPEDLVQHGERSVCEDCAMDLLSPAKGCDPWAVKMAKGSLPTQGEAVASLQGTEKDLYSLVKEQGGVTAADAAAALGLEVREITRAFAVLRHMELLRGNREANGLVTLVPFDQPHV